MEKTISTREYRVLLWQLQKARRLAGVSQEELAERLNKPRTWVGNCERGQRRIDAIELRVICQALGISYVEFIREVDVAIDKELGSEK